MDTLAAIIGTLCRTCFPANVHDCSGLVRAVARGVGISLTGNADAIVDFVRQSADWQVLPDGAEAAQAAWHGAFVIGGLKGCEQSTPCSHGHVVVVLPGACNRGLYPVATWGALGGTGQQCKTVNWAWAASDRDRVSYAAYIGTWLGRP